MESAVIGLRDCIVDDVHIGNRFAEMTETLVARIKPRLFRIPTNQEVGTAAGSRVPSHSPQLAPTRFPAHNNGIRNMNNPPRQLGMNDQQETNNQGYVPQQNYQENPYLQTSASQVTPTFSAFHHSGIPTEMYDVSTNEISFMPPPNFYPGQNYNQYANGASGHSNYHNMDGNADVANHGNAFVVNNNGQPSAGDWVGLPLDPILANYGADVDASVWGPNVNGLDMLDMFHQ